MKTVRLSSKTERSSGCALMALIILLIVLVLRSSGKDALYYIIVGICALIFAAIAAIYVYAVMNAKIEKNGEKSIRVSGLFPETRDCTEAVSVKTVPVAMGPIQSRSIVMYRSSGEEICTISTLFTSKSGVMAEKAAEELAGMLNIEFTPSVNRWEYDKEAMAQHRAEQKKLKKKNKKGHQENDVQKENTKENITENITIDNTDINYDLLDDDK